MEFANSTHAAIFVFSLVLGLIFGFLYDIIRIIHILCGTLSYEGGKTRQTRGVIPSVVLGVGDLLYMTAVTAVFSVFVYYVNNADFRMFMAIGAAIGFALYSLSVGRLVMLVTGTVTNAIRAAIRWAIVKPAVFVAGKTRNLLVFLWRHTFGRAVNALRERFRAAKTEKIRKQFGKDIRFSDF